MNLDILPEPMAETLSPMLDFITASPSPVRPANGLIPVPYLSAHPTGSRYTVTPAVLDTDDDWLVLVPDLDKANEALEAMGLEACLGLSDPYEVEKGRWRFRAWRAGDTNLIVTDDQTMYLRSVAATLLAAKLNVQDKDARIELFRQIRFGVDVGDYWGPLP